VQLDKADFLDAIIKGADLSGANLIGANLIRANLNNSVITGANLYGTARDDWKIEGVKCDYILWNKEKIHFADSKDFEKAFSSIKNVIQVLLRVPYSTLSHGIGQIIEKVFKEEYGEDIVKFKGHEALSDEDVILKFIDFADENKRTEIENKFTNTQRELNLFFEDQKREPRRWIDINDEMGAGDLLNPLNWVVVRPKEFYKQEVIERYSRWHPFWQGIVQIIQQTIR
jgi:hypothetical protein